MSDDDDYYGLLKTIDAFPNDVAPRMILADWLDERGRYIEGMKLRLKSAFPKVHVSEVKDGAALRVEFLTSPTQIEKLRRVINNPGDIPIIIVVHADWLNYFEDWPWSFGLEIPGRRGLHADLKALQGNANLNSLDLRHEDFRPSHVRDLRTLAGLRHLFIGCRRIHAGATRELCSLQRLDSLGFGGEIITSELEAMPRLRSLTLTDFNATTEQFRAEDFPSLETLTLNTPGRVIPLGEFASHSQTLRHVSLFNFAHLEGELPLLSLAPSLERLTLRRFSSNNVRWLLERGFSRIRSLSCSEVEHGGNDRNWPAFLHVVQNLEDFIYHEVRPQENIRSYRDYRNYGEFYRESPDLPTQPLPVFPKLERLSFCSMSPLANWGAFPPEWPGLREMTVDTLNLPSIARLATYPELRSLLIKRSESPLVTRHLHYNLDVVVEQYREGLPNCRVALAVDN